LIHQEKENTINEIKASLIKEEYQNNLKEHMEQKLFDLTYKIKHKDGALSVMEIDSLLRRKAMLGGSPKYSNEELWILFNYYQEFVLKINENTTYIPSKNNFCAFAGISSATYDAYMQSADAERRDIMQKIDDYITDTMFRLSQKGELKEITTMFLGKTQHHMVEASAPVVIQHETKTDTNEIMKQIQAVNQGKSLIELKPNSNGIYEEE